MTDENRADRLRMERSFEAFLAGRSLALPVPPQPTREDVERIRRAQPRRRRTPAPA